MPEIEFAYVAIAADGRRLQGRVSATEEAFALDLIKKNGLVPLSIKKAGSSSLQDGSAKRFRAVPVKDMAMFCRQFSIMIDAGLPVATALRTMSQQLKGGMLSRALGNIVKNLEKGMALHEAFRRCTGAFSDIFISIVKAGERSGNLDTMMTQYAIVLERQYRLKSEVQGALVYPALLGVMGIGVIIFLLVVVLPKFTEILTRANQDLPATTSALLAMSRIITEYHFEIASALLAIAAGFYKAIHTPKGRLLFDTFKLKIPLFGALLFKAAFTRVAQTTAILLQSGVSVLETLSLAAEVVGNRMLALRFHEMREKISRGESLGRQFAEFPYLSPMVVQMISIGEQTGSVEKMLVKIAEYYENEVEVSVKNLTKLIEPVMLLVIGGFVGLIAVSLVSSMMKAFQSLR